MGTFVQKTHINQDGSAHIHSSNIHLESYVHKAVQLYGRPQRRAQHLVLVFFVHYG